jgi:MraZ protein
VPVFKGQFFHAIDAKSRLTIPARLREVVNPAEQGYGFVGVCGFDNVLYLYTPRMYEEVTPRFDARRQTNPAVRGYQRLSYGLADNMELDRLGRVLIPDATKDQCGLKKDVAIVGVQDHIEVWPRDRWQAYVKEQSARHDQLAEQAMALDGEAPGAAAPVEPPA